MNKIFCTRLKELREEKQLTQRQLADKTNIMQANICRWENGNNSPNIEYLKMLCKFFNVTANYLIGLEDFE